MRPQHPSSPLSQILVACWMLVVSLTLHAQQQFVPAPHKPIPPKVEKPIKGLTPAMRRSMIGGLWMTDPDFKASIYLRNNLETDPVAVTPILHLSNGAKYILPDVTVQPADIAIISINDELQKKGISSFATLSGYLELEYIWPWDPFCATIRNIDVPHSLIFTYSLRPTLPLPLHTQNFTPPAPTHTLEGMWWKQERNITGFVTVANLSSRPAEATVEVTDSEGRPVRQHNVTVSPNGMKLVELPELQTIEGAQGGVRVTSSETTDNLVVNGGLEDPTVGYSAILPFAAGSVKPSPEQFTIAELGLMVGAADPMMLFPAGTTFTPYSVVRNVSDTPVSATATLWWMEAGQPRSARLPQIHLAPYQTQSIDVPSLLARFGPKNFNGSFNIVFESQARLGALLLSSGSVDQTGTYVFEAVPRAVAEGASKSFQQWSTSNGDDTMFTLWNPADEAQDLKFTLFFEGGHYDFPLHMQPRETRGFNVSEIIQNQVADAQGNLIPASVRQGTAKLAGSLAENEHILIAADSGIYNVRKATCNNNCQVCDGYVSSAVIPNSFSIPVGGTTQLQLLGTWGNGGAQYDLTSDAPWTSNNGSVETVSNGTVTGVGAGSATITAQASNEPLQASNPPGSVLCTGPNGCPVGTFTGTSIGTVVPPPQITSITPTYGTVGTPATITVNGSNLIDQTSQGVTPNFSDAGVTVKVKSMSSTQVVLALTIPTSVSVGEQNLSLTTQYGTSNTVQFNIGDPPPNITSVNNLTWNAGVVTPIIISGAGFGTNQPTVNVTGAGVTIGLTSWNDNQIKANVTVAADAPPETSTLTVSSNGYNGQGFVQTQQGESDQSSVVATVQPVPLNILSPANNAQFSFVSPSYNQTGNIVFQSSEVGTVQVQWGVNISYTTSGGRGPFGMSEPGFSTTGASQQTETYARVGGHMSVSATRGLQIATVADYITGVSIPSTTIRTRLISLYSGATSQLMTDIAQIESSCFQFKTTTLYGISALWPHESPDGGSHIGLMQMPVGMVDAFDWQANTADGVSLFRQKLSIALGYENQIIAQHQGLRALSATEKENMALVLYGPYAKTSLTQQYYTVVQGAAGWQWVVNNGANGNPNGVTYAKSVRNVGSNGCP